MQGVTYLDHNATTPLCEAARVAMASALAEAGNPSSVHAPGREARRRLEDARAQVAALVGALPAEVVFTSGGTEANNLALRGAGRRRLVVSATEHACVLETASALGNAEIVPVDDDGVIDLGALADILGEDGSDALVSVMAANNETGVVQPVAEAAAIAHAKGALFHCDAAQAAGKLAVDRRELGCDLLTLSAHKLGGPAGVGALVVRDGLPLAPAVTGGGQERRRRAGTENLIGIAGFGAAAEWAQDAAAAFGRLAPLVETIEDALLAEGAVVHGRGAPRLPNTICLGMPGVVAETQVMAFDLDGIAVSAGAACSSGKVEPSHVLRAMGRSEAEAHEAIRVSLGWPTTEDEVERFIAAWKRVRERAGGTKQRTKAEAAA
jgi:cysteine desulfurase